MKYENIGKLYDLVRDDVESMGYFCARVSSTPVVGGSSASSNKRAHTHGGTRVEWEITKRQTGTIRTNCIDCLDRTNVVQSVFARRILEKQLAEFCGFQADKGDKHDALDAMFRNVWANNADAMSFQYSGTGALKTDFTRTGKRSIKGACMDGINSLTRYYLNNFKDGRNQDSVDLFLGIYRPDRKKLSPYALAKQRAHPSHQKSIMGFAWAFTLAMALLVVTWTQLAPPSLTPHKKWSMSTQVAAFGGASLVIGMKLLARYGKDYSNKPILRLAEYL
jgi:hypothetical protein